MTGRRRFARVVASRTPPNEARRASFIDRVLLVAVVALSIAGCAAERGMVTVRKPTVLLVRVAADVQEPTGRTIQATAFFTPPGTNSRPIVLTRAEMPIEIGQSEVPLTVDITLCLGDISDGTAGKLCPLSIALALRDSTNALIDSAAVGPVDVGANSTANFPPVLLKRVGTIAVNPPTTRLVIGDVQTLTAALIAPTGDTLAPRQVKWTSSAPAIATVNATGTVTAVRPGTALISASREDITGSATITVPFQAVTSWSASPPSNALGAGPSPWHTYAMWARSANEIYLAGDGILARFDGTTITRLTTTAGFCCIRAISGTAGDNIYMVGSAVLETNGNFIIRQTGVAYRYNGTTAASFPLPTTENLTGVYAASPNVAFAVGEKGTVYRFDGTAWSRVVVPTARNLRGICGFGENELYAVGDSGTTLRYDGTRWTAGQLGVTTDLLTVHCAAPGSVFAGGAGPGGAVVLRSADGISWTAMALPPRSWGIRSLSGSSPSDLYAVGWNATMLHFDGAAWSPTPSPWDEWSTNLAAVAVAPGVALAGGFEGLTMVNRGTGWQPLGTLTVYRGVWASSPNNILAVGYYGTIDRFDGTRWVSMDSRSRRTFLGVWGSSSTDVWAVGADGLIQHFDGTSWAPTTSPTTLHLERLWGSDARNVWAVGCCGTLVHYTGVSWSLAASPVATDFHGVWGSSASDIFAVGNGGTIIHYDGSQWTRMSSPTTETLWSVWGTGANNVYAVGANETIVRYDGVSWKTIRTAPTASTYFTIWGSGPEDIYALGCGNPGITSRFDGARWRTVTNVCAWAMTGFPSGGAVAVLWGRFAWFGLSPNGQLGASHASAFGGGDAPLSRPVITYGSGTSTPNAPRQ